MSPPSSPPAWDYGTGSVASRDALLQGLAFSTSERGLGGAVALPELIQQVLYPLPVTKGHAVLALRRVLEQCLSPAHPRPLAVVVGPPHVTNKHTTMAWARALGELQTAADTSSPLRFRMVMQCNLDHTVYDTRPRTATSPKPRAATSHLVSHGIPACRALLSAVTNHVPVCCSISDTILPQYLADLYLMATVLPPHCELQLHREAVSGMLVPTGFVADGPERAATVRTARTAAAAPHRFLSVAKNGICAAVATTGNPDTFAVVPACDSGDTMAEWLRATAIPNTDRPHAMLDLGLVDLPAAQAQARHRVAVALSHPGVALQLVGFRLLATGPHSPSHPAARVLRWLVSSDERRDELGDA